MAKVISTISISGVGISIHNKLQQIQGGDPVNDEAYHMTENEYLSFKDLIYKDGVSSLSVNPSFGERGVIIDLDLSYSLTSNDDLYTSASINQGIGNVLPDVDTGVHIVPGGSTAIDKSFILTINYTRNGIPGVTGKTSTYFAYIPQFAGVSVNTDFTLYNTIDTSLTKYIQSSANINKESNPINQYIWFISNKSNAIIKDQNDFLQTQGAWGNADKEFWTKSITLTLADGVTTATVYLFRSRLTKTIPTGFTYKIS